MSLADLIASDVDDVFLVTDDFAETMLRYAGGDRDNTTSVTGVVTWAPTVPSDTRGKGYVRRGELLLNDSVTVTAADAFLINERRYEVESLDDPQYGSRIVRLIRYESEAKGVRKAGDI